MLQFKTNQTAGNFRTWKCICFCADQYGNQSRISRHLAQKDIDWDEQLVLLSMSVLFIIILTTITSVRHDRHTLMFIELMATSLTYLIVCHL